MLIQTISGLSIKNGITVKAMKSDPTNYNEVYDLNERVCKITSIETNAKFP